MRRHNILWLILAVLLATRALVPTGWMPVATADGMRIELCTGQGIVVVTLDADGNIQEDAGEHDAPRETCPYGTLGGPLALPTLPEVAAPPAPISAPPAPTVIPHLVVPGYAPRPPTRGPPTLA